MSSPLLKEDLGLRADKTELSTAALCTSQGSRVSWMNMLVCVAFEILSAVFVYGTSGQINTQCGVAAWLSPLYLSTLLMRLHSFFLCKQKSNRSHVQMFPKPSWIMWQPWFTTSPEQRNERAWSDLFGCCHGPLMPWCRCFPAVVCRTTVAWTGHTCIYILQFIHMDSHLATHKATGTQTYLICFPPLPWFSLNKFTMTQHWPAVKSGEQNKPQYQPCQSERPKRVTGLP